MELRFAPSERKYFAKREHIDRFIFHLQRSEQSGKEISIPILSRNKILRSWIKAKTIKSKEN